MTNHRFLQLGAAFLLLTSALALSQSAAKMPADIDPESHARLPYPQRKDMDEATQKAFDALPSNMPGKTATGVTAGPLTFAAYNPAVAKALLDLHNGAVGQGKLDARVRELAIMVACRETNYNLEWNGHLNSALKAGVDQKVIDIIKNRGALTGVDDKDAAVIRFGHQLLNDRKVDSATFAKIVNLYGKRGAMDMVAVMSTYAVSGLFAVAVDEHPAAGTPELPK